MSRSFALTLAVMVAGHAHSAAAQGRVLDMEAEYTTDLAAVAQGDGSGTVRADYISLAAAIDLDGAIGWHGARLFAQGIAATGSRPNDLAGTAQGINNIEVPDRRARLFQFWVEQALPQGIGSLRIGFSDLNEEFYVTEASGLLIAPAFGIGSELAATGTGGPSTFPSTAATARLRLAGKDGLYAQLALVNAEAGVPGDSGGIRPLLRQGALVVTEAGLSGPVKLALGGWTYTRAQGDTGDPAVNRASARHHARGAYVLAETPVSRTVAGFVRLGLSDGETGVFAGGWQAGALVSPALPGRTASLLSFGVHQGFLAGRFRADEGQQGRPTGRTETGLELAYADQPAPWLTIQPDVQYVRRPCHVAGCADAVIGTLRLTFTADLR